MERSGLFLRGYMMRLQESSTEKKRINTVGAISSKDFGQGDPPRDLKVSDLYADHKEK
jgi:hypothetical protein